MTTITRTLAAELAPGDQFMRDDVTVTITGSREDTTDIFGQAMFRWMAQRSDTGATGYYTFGPDAPMPRTLITQPERTP